jgi:hypothetical protein
MPTNGSWPWMSPSANSNRRTSEQGPYAVRSLLTANWLDARGGDGASWRRLLLRALWPPQASGEASALARW